MNQKHLLILIIAILIIIVLYASYTRNEQTGGANMAGWSYLEDNIKTGNPASWADKTNPLYYKDEFLPNCDRPTNVYFGSPNPLLHQMRPMKIPKDTMFYFANAKASPECCLGGAPYSTSSGCVCAFPKQLYACDIDKPYETPIPGPNSWQRG